MKLHCASFASTKLLPTRSQPANWQDWKAAPSKRLACSGVLKKLTRVIEAPAQVAWLRSHSFTVVWIQCEPSAFTSSILQPEKVAASSWACCSPACSSVQPCSLAMPIHACANWLSGSAQSLKVVACRWAPRKSACDSLQPLNTACRRLAPAKHTPRRSHWSNTASRASLWRRSAALQVQRVNTPPPRKAEA